MALPYIVVPIIIIMVNVSGHRMYVDINRHMDINIIWTLVVDELWPHVLSNKIIIRNTGEIEVVLWPEPHGNSRQNLILKTKTTIADF